MNFKNLSDNQSECICLIKQVDKKTSSRGGDYLDFTLCDKTGEINAKLWDYSEEIYGTFEANELIKVRGKVTQYMNNDQLKIERIRKITASDNICIEDYVPSAYYDGNRMFSELIDIANGFEDEDLTKIAVHLLEENKEKMMYWPAALKMHHAMRGGLLTHTLSLVRLAQKFCDIYPCLDADLLLCGAMLHDIAKLEEYAVPDTGIASGYTAKGTLLGHLVMGAMDINETAKKLGINQKTAELLEHMLLSHHGIPEFGAAVRPMFPEAEVLSAIDNLDATVFEYFDILSDVPVGEFSSRVWALDNRKLYNHGRTKGEFMPKLF